MSSPSPMLHLLCGMAASGKSTLAARLGQAPDTVVLSEDIWLSALFGDQMSSLADYVSAAARLRTVMAPHCVALLRAGLSVVLDFPANTVETRRWMRGIVDAAEARHRLHLLETPADLCRARLRARNAAADHPFTVTQADFDRLAAHFRPPTDDEGFMILRHPAR